MAMATGESDFSMRSPSKGLSWLEPYDDLFDSYIDTSMFIGLDSILDANNSHSIETSCDGSMSSLSRCSDFMNSLSMPIPSSPQQKMGNPWPHSDSFEEGGALLPDESIKGCIYPDSYGRASASDPELFSHKDHLLQEPPSSPVCSSPPLSPLPSGFSTSFPTASNFGFSIAKRSITGRSLGRKSPPPTMMRSSHYRPLGHQNVWSQKRGHAVNLQLVPRNSPMPTPPPSGKEVHTAPAHSCQFPRQFEEVDSMEEAPERSIYVSQGQLQLTPSSTPPGHDIATFPIHEPLSTESMQSAFRSLSPADQYSMPPSSPGINVNIIYPGTASPLYPIEQSKQPQQPQAYWPGACTAPSEVSNNGLMIQCEPFLAGIHGVAQFPFKADTKSRGPSSQAPSQPTYAFPDSPSQPKNVYAYAALGNRGMPRTPSPSRHTQPQLFNPSSASTRRSGRPRPASMHGAPASQRASQANHHRRKSSGAAHLRSRSDNHAGSASLDFVNFTPNDRSKILTGVAPSGSSKTKARREKEAADKRRKMSMAARAAVIEAGGDLSVLEREGVFTEP